MARTMDWRSPNARRHEEAEAFFFRCHKDFACVCASAGIDARSFQGKLAGLMRADDDAGKLTQPTSDGHDLAPACGGSEQMEKTRHK